MRGCAWSLVALVLGCGPHVADEGGGADGSGESGATASTTTGTTSADASTTSAGDESSVDTGPAIFDLGIADVGSDRPLGCDLPDNPNSDVSGTTPAGKRTYTAAAFAEVGGGKCPLTYEIALAADPAALAAALSNGFPGELVVTLVVPQDGARPGEWTALVHLAEAPADEALASATVQIVPDFQSPAPLLQAELTILDPAWTLSGTIAAHYCELLASGPCGA